MRSYRLLSLVVFLFAVAGGFAQQASQDDILAELKKRKVLDVEALKKRVDRLATLNAPELEAELKLLQKEQDAVMEDWKKIDTLRRTKRPGVPPMELRTAGFALKKWQAEREREAPLEAMQEREEKAFEKRYKQTLSRVSEEYKEWINTDEYRTLEKEKAEINNGFVTKLRELAEDADHGNVDSEKALANMQRQIVGEYDQTARALDRTVAALDTKKGNEPAQAVTGLFQKTADRQLVRTPLTLKVRRDGNERLPVGVGDPVKIHVKIGNGIAPYYLSVVSSDGYSITHYYSGPGEHGLLFTFKTPGEHSIHFTLSDVFRWYTFDHHRVRVIQLKDPKEKQPDPPIPPPVKKDPPPPPPLLTPFSGTYRAHLWISGVPHPGEQGIPIPPTPVSLTFDTSGAITGKCNYTAPDSLFKAHHRSLYSSTKWTTKFTIQGKVDWQTGKIDLKIPDGNIHVAYVSREYGPSERFFEYSATVSGRHTSDPSWEKSIPTFGAKIPTSRFEELGLPLVGTGPMGQARFTEDGWFGAGELEPGGTATGNVQVKKFALKHFDPDKVTDLTAGYKAGGGGLWHLKLLGPDTTEKDLAKAELVGTSIWPERKTTAKVGERVNVQFVGVFGSNYTEIRDLTNIADWQLSPGLTQVQPGVFSAAKPGQYTVRARAKGKGGVWMEGYVTIQVVGS